MSTDTGKERWVHLHKMGRKERRPYRECPNCGRYKLTTIRVFRPGGLLFGESKTYQWDHCNNCKYSTEKEEIHP